MRRMILAAATSSLVLALVPAGAMARQHSHHKRHHARHHQRVHRVIHRRFGDVNNPATTPTTGTPASDVVGTVDSFTNGTLTIKLNSGSTVSGTVTNDTEIECASSTVMTDTRRDGGGGSGSGDSSGGDHGDRGDRGDQGDDNDQDDQGEQACTTANLTPGASVRGAELKISSAGAVWDKVDLIS